jgi:transposase
MSNVLRKIKNNKSSHWGSSDGPWRRIERETSVRRETASVYLKAAGVAVHQPGWGRRSPAKPATGVTTDPEPTQAARPANSSPKQELSASVCEPYREAIQQGLARGRNATAIWQDLVSDHGFTGGYQAVKRFVRKLRGTRVPEAAGIILTSPGEEAQVDYGSGPMERHTRKRTDLRL